MRCLLFIFGLAVLTSQYVEAQANYESIEQLQTLQRSQRGTTDIWNTIKKSAINAWNSIKNIAQNTKDKINKWIENIKGHIVDDITAKLEERIKDLHEKSKALIEKLISTGKLVKECLKEENDEIEKQLKRILEYVTSCISDSLKNLAHLDRQARELDFNETYFITDVEDKMNKCLKQEDVEECLLEVRRDVYSAMENMEEEVMTSRMESRGIADDVLHSVVSCSVEGLIDASNVIANETTTIINCVKEG